jgi:two-component system nitrate/nitrite response regulator NarL
MSPAGVARPKPGRYQRPQLRIHRWSKSQPRVAVVHEVRIVGSALRIAMAGQAQILSQTVFGKAGVALAEIVTPDVIVAGDVLVDGPLDQFLPALVRTGSRILVLCEDVDLATGVELLRQGANGVISKHESLDQVASAVMTIARGEAVIPGLLGEVLLRGWRASERLAEPAAAAGITEREQEVLAAMVDGLGTKAIAHRLGIALKTVENHKTRIFQKLGVRTQAEVISLVMSTSRPQTHND